MYSADFVFGRGSAFRTDIGVSVNFHGNGGG